MLIIKFENINTALNFDKLVEDKECHISHFINGIKEETTYTFTKRLANKLCILQRCLDIIEECPISVYNEEHTFKIDVVEPKKEEEKEDK